MLERAGCIIVSDIHDILLEKATLSFSIVVLTKFDTLKIPISYPINSALVNILYKTITLLQNQEIGTTKTEQIQSDRSPICAGCGAKNPDSFHRCEYCGSLIK